MNSIFLVSPKKNNGLQAQNYRNCDTKYNKIENENNSTNFNRNNFTQKSKNEQFSNKIRSGQILYFDEKSENGKQVKQIRNAKITNENNKHQNLEDSDEYIELSKRDNQCRNYKQPHSNQFQDIPNGKRSEIASSPSIFHCHSILFPKSNNENEQLLKYQNYIREKSQKRNFQMSDNLILVHKNTQKHEISNIKSYDKFNNKIDTNLILNDEDEFTQKLPNFKRIKTSESSFVENETKNKKNYKNRLPKDEEEFEQLFENTRSKKFDGLVDFINSEKITKTSNRNNKSDKNYIQFLLT